MAVALMSLFEAIMERDLEANVAYCEDLEAILLAREASRTTSAFTSAIL